ncbi:MAG TPA: sensor domain-containing diguanylate cyclase [bacterium]|nr:sensor domain-containing diguanylate cyclase [bacterium]
MTTYKPDISRTDGTLGILREVGKALTATLDLDQVLSVIMDMIAKLYEPKNWSLLLVDEETEELYFQIVVGKASQKLRNIRMKIGEGIAGWVAKNGEPLIIPDVDQDQRFAKWVDQKSGFKTKSIVCIPLISKGRTLGVIELINVAEAHREKEHLELLEALADFAAIAIENARFVKRVRELTIVDDCTGLYNARHMHNLLETEINRAIRYNYPFSVVFLDLDHFKDVNDTYGHLIGSRLLKEIGQLLKFNLRTVDWAVRYGGDEFVLILPRAGKEDALMVGQRLRRGLNDAVFFVKEELNIRVTASFGIGTYPDDALNKEDIIKMADQAMYRVKNSTRDGICMASQSAGECKQNIAPDPA